MQAMVSDYARYWREGLLSAALALITLVVAAPVRR
jgi:hypothetical protein